MFASDFSSLVPQSFPKFLFKAILIGAALSLPAVNHSAHAATIDVPSGGDFQAALNLANCGDTIVLQAGGSYIVSVLEQPFLAKAKGACTGTDADFITIQGSNSNTLPSSLRDLSPSQIRALSLPKLITKVSTPALEFQAGSHHYRFLGIEITNDSLNQTLVNNGLVFAGIQHGSSSNITLATVPRKIEFDRTWVHGEEDGTDSTTATCLRAFWLGAAEFTIKNSRLGGFRVFYPGTQGPGASSHAVLIEKGPGPYLISNNYIEAWFASIFTGGGPQWITNQATVAPGATTTQATLSNVNNLAVGDYIAFRVTGQGSHYQVARVSELNGNSVAYVPQGGLDGPSSGNPLVVAPETPGDAVWNGDTPKNLTITNNVFWKNPVVGAAAAALGYYGKGHMEFKTATDTLVEGNDFSGYSAGFTITSRNQSTWTTATTTRWSCGRTSSRRWPRTCPALRDAALETTAIAAPLREVLLPLGRSSTPLAEQGDLVLGSPTSIACRAPRPGRASPGSSTTRRRRRRSCSRRAPTPPYRSVRCAPTGDLSSSGPTTCASPSPRPSSS